MESYRMSPISSLYTFYNTSKMRNKIVLTTVCPTVEITNSCDSDEIFCVWYHGSKINTMRMFVNSSSSCLRTKNRKFGSKKIQFLSIFSLGRKFWETKWSSIDRSRREDYDSVHIFLQKWKTSRENEKWQKMSHNVSLCVIFRGIFASEDIV